MDENKQEEGFQFSLTEKETSKVIAWANDISKSMSEIDQECFGGGIVYEFSPFEFGERIVVKYQGKKLLIRSAFEDDEIK